MSNDTPTVCDCKCHTLGWLHNIEDRNDGTICCTSAAVTDKPRDTCALPEFITMPSDARCITPAVAAAAFTEWERRYREEPERFATESAKLAKSPESYGDAAAPYFLAICDELAPKYAAGALVSEGTGVVMEPTADNMVPGHRRIPISEFRALGFLQEANRLFFHPLGLALEVAIDDDGNETLGGVWDSRDDPEGVIYGDGVLDVESVAKAAHVAAVREAHRPYREALLNGSDVQHIVTHASAVSSPAVASLALVCQKGQCSAAAGERTLELENMCGCSCHSVHNYCPYPPRKAGE